MGARILHSHANGNFGDISVLCPGLLAVDILNVISKVAASGDVAARSWLLLFLGRIAMQNGTCGLLVPMFRGPYVCLCLSLCVSFLATPMSFQKRLNWSRCHLRYTLEWTKETRIRWGPGKDNLRQAPPGLLQCMRNIQCGVLSIFSTLLGTWQQRCGLLPSIVTQYSINVLLVLPSCAACTTTTAVNTLMFTLFVQYGTIWQNGKQWSVQCEVIQDCL